MKLQNWIRVIAGTLITATALLGWLASPLWLLGTIFVGLNLLQYGFSDWCLMATMLKKMGVEE